VPGLLAALRVFERASNQRANVHKTKALPIGAVPSGLPGHTPGGLQIVSEATALGFTFAAGVGAVQPAGGWDSRIASAHLACVRLLSQPLSAFGRAYAANSYACSKLLYHLEFADLPQERVLRLQADLATFVDRSRAPGAAGGFAGVQALLLPGPPASGGFGLLPLREHVEARRAVWMSRLASGGAGHPWASIACALLQRRSAWSEGVWPRFVPPLAWRLPSVLQRMFEAAALLCVPSLHEMPPREGVLAEHVPGWMVGQRFVPVEDLTVRAATALIMQDSTTQYRRDVRHREFVERVALAPGASDGQINAAVQQLRRVLPGLWRLSWTNDHKEVYWRMVVDGLPTLARLQGVPACRCPCAVAGGGGQRPGLRHYFGQCYVAQAVRQELSRCCFGTAEGVTVQQVLLVQPPAGVRLPVWRVVCLASVEAMWRCRLLQRPGGRELTPVDAAQQAVGHFWSLLHDFCRVGRFPGGERRRMRPDHPFLRYGTESGPLLVAGPSV